MKKVELLDNETFTIKGTLGEVYVFDGQDLFVDPVGAFGSRKATVVKSLRTEAGARDWLKIAGSKFTNAEILTTEALKANFDELEDFESEDMPFHVAVAQDVDNDEDVDEAHEELVDELRDEDEMDEDSEDSGEYADGEMALTQVEQILHDSVELMQMIKDESNLAPWVQSKLTRAADYMNVISEYLDHNEDAQDMLDEEDGDNYDKDEDSEDGKNSVSEIDKISEEITKSVLKAFRHGLSMFDAVTGAVNPDMVTTPATPPAPEPSPTPTPEPSPTPAPEPTPTPTPAPVPEATPEPAPEITSEPATTTTPAPAAESETTVTAQNTSTPKTIVAPEVETTPEAEVSLETEATEDSKESGVEKESESSTSSGGGGGFIENHRGFTLEALRGVKPEDKTHYAQLMEMSLGALGDKSNSFANLLENLDEKGKSKEFKHFDVSLERPEGKAGGNYKVVSLSHKGTDGEEKVTFRLMPHEGQPGLKPVTLLFRRDPKTGKFVQDNKNILSIGPASQATKAVKGLVFKSLHAARQWNKFENPDKDRYYVDIMRVSDSRSLKSNPIDRTRGLNSKYIVRDMQDKVETKKGAYGNRKVTKNVNLPEKSIDAKTREVAALNPPQSVPEDSVGE